MLDPLRWIPYCSAGVIDAYIIESAGDAVMPDVVARRLRIWDGPVPRVLLILARWWFRGDTPFGDAAAERSKNSWVERRALAEAGLSSASVNHLERSWKSLLSILLPCGGFVPTVALLVFAAELLCTVCLWLLAGGLTPGDDPLVMD